MQEQHEQNLQRALAVIAAVQGRIAEMRRSGVTAEEIAAEEDLLRHAEAVRASMTLQVLRGMAEAKAAELLALDARRRELVASLQTYGDAALSIGGQTQRTLESRKISAALLLGLEPPDVGAFDDARRGWQIAADELLQSHITAAAPEQQGAATHG